MKQLGNKAKGALTLHSSFQGRGLVHTQLLNWFEARQSSEPHGILTKASLCLEV